MNESNQPIEHTQKRTPVRSLADFERSRTNELATLVAELYALSGQAIGAYTRSADVMHFYTPLSALIGKSKRVLDLHEKLTKSTTFEDALTTEVPLPLNEELLEQISSLGDCALQMCQRIAQYNVVTSTPTEHSFESLQSDVMQFCRHTLLPTLQEFMSSATTKLSDSS